MADPAQKTAQIVPIRPQQAAMSAHKYTTHNVTVAGPIDEDMIIDPRLWALVPRLASGDEIRVIAEDMTFRAVLLVVFVNGNDKRMQLLSHQVFEDVGEIDIEGDIITKHQGFGKWGLWDKRSGAWVSGKKNFESKVRAEHELNDYKRAMAS